MDPRTYTLQIAPQPDTQNALAVKVSARAKLSLEDARESLERQLYYLENYILALGSQDIPRSIRLLKMYRARADALIDVFHARRNQFHISFFIEKLIHIPELESELHAFALWTPDPDDRRMALCVVAKQLMDITKPREALSVLEEIEHGNLIFPRYYEGLPSYLITQHGFYRRVLKWIGRFPRKESTRMLVHAAQRFAKQNDIPRAQRLLNKAWKI